MPKYIVTGRIQPERADISFGQVKTELDGGGTVVVSSDSSQITVVLDVPSIDGWITAKIIADDIANTVVGALAFSLGSGYWADLIQVTEEDGTPHVFGVQPTGDAPTETLGFKAHIEVFNRALRLSARDVFFRLAVRDFLQGVTDVADCATYCYRAIEGIKASFVFKSGISIDGTRCTPRWARIARPLRPQSRIMPTPYVTGTGQGRSQPTDSFVGAC